MIPLYDLCHRNEVDAEPTCRPSRPLWRRCRAAGAELQETESEEAGSAALKKGARHPKR